MTWPRVLVAELGEVQERQVLQVELGDLARGVLCVSVEPQRNGFADAVWADDHAVVRRRFAVEGWRCAGRDLRDDADVNPVTAGKPHDRERELHSRRDLRVWHGHRVPFDRACHLVGHEIPQWR